MSHLRNREPALASVQIKFTGGDAIANLIEEFRRHDEGRNERHRLERALRCGCIGVHRVVEDQFRAGSFPGPSVPEHQTELVSPALNEFEHFASDAGGDSARGKLTPEAATKGF